MPAEEIQTTMLYKAPGPHAIHGGMFDYRIVPDDQIEAALAEGWHLTTPQAKAAHEAEQAAKLVASAGATASAAATNDDAKPTRDELEQKATELGIPFSARVSDKKLAAEIAAKLAE